jgi:transposase
MSRWKPCSREELVHQVVLLSQQGMSRRAIGRSLHVSRNKVRKILDQHQVHRDGDVPPTALPPLPASRPSKLDEHEVFVKDLLERFPDLPAQRVFEELREQKSFEGGYTIVKEYVRELRPRPVVKPSTPVEEPHPGKLAESDWGNVLVPFLDGHAKRLQFFSYTLAYSNRKYFDFYDRPDVHALMDGHVLAFDHFDGVAEVCKYDSQKPVVLRWEGPQPIYNPRFIAFATHYRFRPEACRRRHPNDKPHVELSIKDLRGSFFKGRRFRDQEDLREQLRHWLATIPDERPQRRKQRRTPLELFADEKPHLVPLPRHPYDTARVVYRVCDIEGFVAWEGNRYSLPVVHVTDLLPVRITQHEIFVYAQNLELVARHELRARGAGEDVIAAGHRPKAERGPGLDQLRSAYRDLGNDATDFLGELEKAQPRSAGYHARQVLLLRGRYDTQDVLAAMDHARRYGALEYRAVERILIARAAPRRLDEYVAEATEKKLAAAVGESRTEPRDLTGYDALPNWSQPKKQGETPCEKQQGPAPGSSDGVAKPASEETKGSSGSSASTSSDSD